MNTERFKNYQDDVRRLVLDFESMQNRGDSRYYDVDQLETIIDFYLDTADEEMLEKSVVYGESLFPTSNEIKLRRVHLLCVKERYKEAFRMLKQLEQMEPENTDVLYALGVVHGALEQPRKAIQYYQKAATDGYELGIIYGNMADEYVKMGQYREAQSFYRKALKQNPDDEHALYNLAACYDDEGTTDKWISFFRRFIEDNPYSKVAWYCLAEAYIVESLYEKAMDACEYAIAIDPSFFNAYLLMSDACVLAGDSNRAVSTLHDALDYSDDKALIYFQIANIFKESNNLVTANVYYGKAVNEDPFYGDAWIAMATCDSLLGDNQAALDEANRALKTNPDSPVYIVTLAIIYADSGNAKAAEELFNLVIDLHSDFDHGWIAFADFLISESRFDEAIEVLSRGLPECEYAFEFNLRLAYCYFITGHRNMLFNIVRACLYDNDNGADILLSYCPEMKNDIDVMNIITSYRQEQEQTKNNNI